MGITYRGKHSYRDIGVEVRIVSRPIVPPVRTTERVIPQLDGSMDYSNSLGRLVYDEKLVELEFTIVDKKTEGLNKKVNDLVVWLTGWYDDLIFDDLKNVIWRARPVSVEGLEKEITRVGKVIIQFRCKPFNISNFSAMGIPLNSMLSINSDIPLSYGFDSKYILTNGGNVIEYNYTGTAPCSPILKINGTNITSVTVACNGSSLVYDKSFKNLIIDCENWRCYADDEDVSSNVSGDYIEFMPGVNPITIILAGAGELILDFRKLFLFGGDIW